MVIERGKTGGSTGAQMREIKGIACDVEKCMISHSCPERFSDLAIGRTSGMTSLVPVSLVSA